MDAQLRGHFRGRFAAVEPQLNGLAFEGFIELLSGLLGLDHRFTHTRLLALCLFCTCVRQIGAAPNVLLALEESDSNLRAWLGSCAFSNLGRTIM